MFNCPEYLNGRYMLYIGLSIAIILVSLNPVVTFVSLSKTLNYNYFSPPRGKMGNL